MKQTLICIILGCWAINMLAQNTITVNHQTNQTAQFTDLQTAIDNAQSGDRILLQGADENYGEILIDKTIHIFGSGYFLTENTETQDYLQSSKVTKFTILSSGSGSSLNGLELTDGSNAIRIEGANNVVINACKFRRAVVNTNAQNAIFQACFLENAAFGINSITVSENATASVSNCIFVGDKNISISDGAEIEVQHCFLLNDIFTGVQATNFSNNIFAAPTISSTFIAENNFHNNLFVADVNVADNLPNIPLSSLFPTSSFNNDLFDHMLQLIPNSPASGYATDGTDAGPFGGNVPYQLSGLPAIPHIYELHAPVTVPANGTMNVSIKAKVGQ